MRGTISVERYEELRARLDRRMAWLKGLGRNWYRSEEEPADVRVANDELSQVEVYEFVIDPPDRYVAYVAKRDHPTGAVSYVLTTWTGDVLGKAQLGLVYVSNLGDTRRPIWVRAINGRTYYGTYYCGAGDYCRLKAHKLQSAAA